MYLLKLTLNSRLLENDGFFELVIEIQQSLRIYDAQFHANSNEVLKMFDMDSLIVYCVIIYKLQLSFRTNSIRLNSNCKLFLRNIWNLFITFFFKKPYLQIKLQLTLNGITLLIVFTFTIFFWRNFVKSNDLILY